MERCDRAALLIDADVYFGAVRRAMLKARRSIRVLGWDICSALRLARGEGEGEGERLDRFLNRLAAERPGLRIELLTWDFSILLAKGREWFQTYRLGWKTHRRVRFRMDDEHPPGACHHQKVVVVDGSLAFVGGLDLTMRRWDTPEHRAEDPRRVDPYGDPYRPFHDLQWMVDGAAARAIDGLVRDRWFRATGERLAPGEAGPAVDPWPEGFEADFQNVEIGIARTLPPYKGKEEAREIENLYLAAVRAARDRIYIENQYFTSDAVGEALGDRLRERDGPEVVVLTPPRTDGWLAQHTMDVLRHRLVKRLRECDRFGRFRIYSPVVPGLGDDFLMLHSKLIAVDDRFLQVGSANLCNRSMGFDTECDLALEAVDEKVAGGIRRLRNRFLGEHLGRRPEEVEAACRGQGSLGAAIESLRGGERTVEALDNSEVEDLESVLPDAGILDPERPIRTEFLARHFLPQMNRRYAFRVFLPFLAILAGLLLLSAVWFATPLRRALEVSEVLSALDAIRGSPATPLIVLGGFVLAALLAVPVTLLSAVTILFLGPAWGFPVALGGSLLSAAVAYGVGQFLGQDAVQYFAGRRLNRISRALARRGVLSVAAIRLIPIAPFTVVNLVAGTSHIRLLHFLIGTAIGMAPGLAGLSLVLGPLELALRNPIPGSHLGLLLIGGAALVALVLLLRRLRKPAAPGKGKVDARSG